MGVSTMSSLLSKALFVFTPFLASCYGKLVGILVGNEDWAITSLVGSVNVCMLLTVAVRPSWCGHFGFLGI